MILYKDRVIKYTHTNIGTYLNSLTHNLIEQIYAWWSAGQRFELENGNLIVKKIVNWLIITCNCSKRLNRLSLWSNYT